ncbi:hypothetical protein [Schumannella sp. 10F1B-5-1]|uniref:hypothetical protein n=1 Tax=Schumannella sp. 10F1B-5-1 TaxID=2590780 RepID=UPI001130ED0A|nr:hypothetical protein [Schumannella sp. 10F1B-5-1]TPW71642.1 hypothetical protein FJ658_09825 [Schumannella sp. 10F1B-5-1]
MSADAALASRAAIGMHLLLPPGWEQLIVAADGTSPDLERLLTRAVAAQSGEQRAGVAALLETLRSQLVGSLAAQGQSVLLVPTRPIEGIPVPASITARPLTPPDDGRTAEDVLVAFAARHRSTAVELDGALGLRREQSTAARTADDGSIVPASRRISYLLHLPGGTRWALLDAVILRPDVEGADDALVAVDMLCDAIMSTVSFDRSAS